MTSHSTADLSRRFNVVSTLLTVFGAVRMARTHHRTKRRTAPVYPPHRATGGGVARATTSPERAGTLPRRRPSVATAACAGLRVQSVTAGEVGAWWPAYAAAHVLLAFGDAGCSGTGHSGASWTSGPLDHPALYAPESGRDRGGDSAARSPIPRQISGEDTSSPKSDARKVLT